MTVRVDELQVQLALARQVLAAALAMAERQLRRVQQLRPVP